MGIFRAMADVDITSQVEPDPEADARPALAANRFGLGARPGDLAAMGDGVGGWLTAQLVPAPVPDTIAALPSGDVQYVALMKARASEPARRAYAFRTLRQEFHRQAAIHAVAATVSERPFRERLVRFWCNHFSVSVRNPDLYALAPAFERDVVRANLDRSFIDMLQAAVRHPAMQVAVGQARAVGPNSRVGLKTREPLQTTLARAILRHHTLGPKGTYEDGDVQNLARLLTGWSLAGTNEPRPGSFVYRADWHEPGNKPFLGRNFPESGILEGEAALDMLARHPETMRRLAGRMASHFVADNPAPVLVRQIARAYARTDGQLPAMAQAMIAAPESWEPEPAKVKRPDELVISVLRALGVRPEDGRLLVRWMRALGQPPYAAPNADGWSDQAGAWTDPERLLERLEWCAGLAGLGKPTMSPIEHAIDVMGPTVRPATLRRMAVAVDDIEALAILFASPEFQQR